MEGWHSKDEHIVSAQAGRRVPGGRNSVLFDAVSPVVSPIPGIHWALKKNVLMPQEHGDRLVYSLPAPKEANKMDGDNGGWRSLPNLPHQIPTNVHIHTKVDKRAKNRRVGLWFQSGMQGS